MEKLDLQTLEKKLWDCANILRGELSSAEYKDYIFGLLFLKRMNDQFDLEREKLIEKYKNKGMDDETIEALISDPSLYEIFYVPE